MGADVAQEDVNPSAIGQRAGAAPGTAQRVRWGDRTKSLVAALLMIGVGYGGACLINGAIGRRAPIAISSSFNGFAVLFVMALAVERMVQPFSSWLGPDTDVQKQELASVQAQGGSSSADATKAQSDLQEGRDLTGVVCWGMATGIAFVLVSATNATLLSAILTSGKPTFYWDLLLTGFAVGAGTKPLNDLVTRLQNK